MGKRNTYGTGSLFYNKAKKRWVVAIAQPSTIDGKRRRLQRSFRTKQEAFAYFNEAQHGIGDGRTLLVADLLGHSTVATTRRHYVRALCPTVPHATQLDMLMG